MHDTTEDLKHLANRVLCEDVTALDEDAYRQLREMGLGGSDAAAALSMSPYVTPWELWHRKRGELPPQEVTEPMFWGTEIEPVIAKRWANDHGETGAEFNLYRTNAMYQHAFHPWATCSPDGLIDHDGVLEIKCVSGWVASKWDDGRVPSDYLIQIQWELEVLDREYAVFAILIDGAEYRDDKTHGYRFERDREIGAALVEKLGAFWRSLGSGGPPAVGGTDRVADLYPVHDEGEVVELAGDAVENLYEADQLKQEINQLEERRALHLNRVREQMGSAEVAVVDGEKIATWKTDANGRRVLRPTKRKKK